MKLLPVLRLALLGACLIAAAPSVSAPPKVSHPSLRPEVRQRLAQSALNGSFAPWQRRFMMETARTDAAGLHAASGLVDGVWTQTQIAQAPPPSARVEPTAIYDPVRDRMVVFGGTDGITYLDEVWALSLSGTPEWVQLTPPGPPPRYAHSAVYDPVRDRMLVFGGYYFDGAEDHTLNDVWALSLAGEPTWTELTPAGAPPSPRIEHTAIYDPMRDRMVVFGGLDAGYLNDVWELSLSGTPEWVQITPMGPPPSGRFAHSAVYDPVRDRMLVFGGYYFDGAEDHNLNDAWALSLAGGPVWTQLSPGGTAPSGRLVHRALYDPIRDRMVVFGGRVFNLDFNNEVWELSLAGSPMWSLLTSAEIPPSARGGHCTIYDPIRDRMVVFGGGGDPGPLNDSWALSLAGSPAWVQFPGGQPSGRYVHTAIYDRVRDRMVLFGGVDGDWVNDIWTLSLSSSPSWNQLAPVGTPPESRGAHTAIYDPVRDRMVIFGGAGGEYFNDVWVLSLSGSPVWTRLTPEGVLPSARNWHTAIYDPVRDRMVVFGGVYFDGVEHYFNDVWALSLAGSLTWTQLVPTGTPPDIRSEHSAIYDPVRDRMVIFGGFYHNGTNHLLDDVWTLSLSSSPAWTELAPAGAQPSARAAHTAIYDPARDRMVVFGGYDGTFRNDVWALSLTGNSAWVQLAPAGPLPGGRVRNTAIFDLFRDRMVVFGGYDFDYLGDLWNLAWGTPVGVLSQTEENVLRLALAYPNPSRNDVSIGFTLPRMSEATLRVYDVSGRLVSTLAEGTLPAGPHVLRWDRRLSSGALAPSGSYFYELRMEGQKLARRVVFIK